MLGTRKGVGIIVQSDDQFAAGVKCELDAVPSSSAECIQHYFGRIRGWGGGGGACDGFSGGGERRPEKLFGDGSVVELACA